MKDLKHIKGFKESYKINENISESSKDDLIDLKNELKFINEYNVEIYEVIEIVDKLLTMSWSEIEEWREHIDTNYTKDNKDKFILRLIDRYCSDTEP